MLQNPPVGAEECHWREGCLRDAEENGWAVVYTLKILYTIIFKMFYLKDIGSPQKVKKGSHKQTNTTGTIPPIAGICNIMEKLTLSCKWSKSATAHKAQLDPCHKLYNFSKINSHYSLPMILSYNTNVKLNIKLMLR